MPFKVRKQITTDHGYNRFGNIVNPKSKGWKIRDRNNLATSDIEGASPNVFGKLSHIKGRDYINIGDIKGTKPNYEVNKFSNKKNFSLITKDITEDGKKEYKKGYNPLDPNYVMYTKSRRQKLVIKSDASMRPKKHITPSTRRHTNHIGDIERAEPRKRTWVRKFETSPDDGSDRNTSLPLKSSSTTRNQQVNSRSSGLFASYEQSHSVRNDTKRIDSQIKREIPPSQRFAKNLSSKRISTKAGNHEKENFHKISQPEMRIEKSAPRRNSYSPSKILKDENTSLPKLSIPSKKKETMEIGNNWKRGSTRRNKYSNLVLYNQSMGKVGRVKRYNLCNIS